MPNTFDLTVQDPADVLDTGQYGVGAIARLQSSATQAGAFADITGTGSTPTITIAATQEVYVAHDPNGVDTTWYRTRYENAGATRVSKWFPAFQVSDPMFGSYVSLQTFRTFLRNQSSPTADQDSDVELLALQSAARAIDRECGRTFRLATSTATARVFTAARSTAPTGWFYGSRYACEIDDLQDATGIAVAFDATGNGSYTTANTQFRVGPANAPSAGMPYRWLTFDIGVIPPLHADAVQVTALWGWSAIPSGIVTANLVQAARFVKRRDSPFGVAGSPEMGNELRLLAKIDPDVAVMLRPYKLDWGYA